LAQAGLSTADRPLGANGLHAAGAPVAGRTAALCRHGDLIALGLLAVIVSALLLPAAIRLPLAIPLDYNEGWNAYQALRAIGDQPLYPPPGDLTGNNYPPLSFYLIGWLGVIFGDHIVIGRTIALVSLLAVACNVGLIVRTLGGSSRLAAFGALLLLGYLVVHAPAYVGTNDPQLLAHALMTAALLLFLRGGRSSLSLIATAALAFLCGLVKHSLIPLPLAITGWLWWHDRRAFAVWLMASAALLLIGGGLLYAAYGPPFFLDLLRTPRLYSLGLLADRSSQDLLPLLPMLGASLLLWATEHRRPEVQFLTLYILFATLWGVFVLGGAGTDVNAVFDVAIGASIAAALALERLPGAPSRAGPRATLLRTAGMVALMLPILVSTPLQVFREAQKLRHLDRLRDEIAADIRFLAARDGPVACEALALCYWAGKDFALDFFIAGQKVREGVIDESTLTRALREHRFAAVQVCGRGGVPWSPRLPQGVNRALRENYGIGRSSPSVGAILVPGPPAIGSQSEVDIDLTGRNTSNWAC
jgi:hypothetical protein